MWNRDRLLLVASAALNVVLVFVLVARGSAGTEPESIASQPTPEPVVVTVVATPTQGASDSVSPTGVPSPTTESLPTSPAATPSAEPPATIQPTSEAPAQQPTAEATTEAATPEPDQPTSAAPTPAPEPSPEASPPAETVVAENLAGPDWLIYLNRFRQQAKLPLVVENSDWSRGALAHGTYMLNTGQLMHDEDVNSQWYDKEGQVVAKNGNIYADSWDGSSYRTALDYWVSATFHAVPMFDPRLSTVGFGLQRDPSAVNRTGLAVAATLDVNQGRDAQVGQDVYPLTFPAAGSQTWVLYSGLPEFPNPLAACPGFSRRTGPPIILMVGDGSLSPKASGYSLQADGQALDGCLFDENSYFNPSEFAEKTGRQILGERDAVVLIPRQPLEANKTYAVTITVDGQPFSWEFSTTSSPP